MAISINSLLDSLPEKTNSTDLREWCDLLYQYYEENGRHSYADITEYIFSKEGGIEYARNLVPVLKGIQKTMEEEKIRANMGKLIDHIRLEIIRYDRLMEIILSSVENNYMEMMNASIEGFDNVLREVNAQAGETKDMLERQKEQAYHNERMLAEQKNQADENAAMLEKQKAQMDEVEGMAKTAEDKVAAVQTENVAILGIFASIVFAFTGLMTFSSSVLENISYPSAYRVLLVCLVIGFVFMNVIGILVSGIRRIVYWKSKENADTQRLRDWKDCLRENFLWLVADGILVVLMCCTVYGWKHSTEKEVQDAGRKKYIEDLWDDSGGDVSGNDIFMEDAE